MSRDVLSSVDLDKMQAVNEALKHIDRKLKSLSSGDSQDITISFPSTVADSELAHSLSETLIIAGYDAYKSARLKFPLELGESLREKWASLPERVVTLDKGSRKLLYLLRDAARLTVELLTKKVGGYNDLHKTSGVLLVSVTTDGFIVDLLQNFWDVARPVPLDQDSAMSELIAIRDTYVKHNRYVLITFQCEEEEEEEEASLDEQKRAD